MILLIDNYDSFTYNLVQAIGQLGIDIRVAHNDKISLDEIEQLAPEKIIISPGPGTPNDAGISMEVITHFAERMPILGVCLGHQALAQCFGGKIISAQTIMHGKTSDIHHSNQDIFAGLPSPFTATRYHSLAIEKNSLPACFEITAWTENNDQALFEIMGIKHKQYPLYGVQFHPESILTSWGSNLLQNYVNI